MDLRCSAAPSRRCRAAAVVAAVAVSSLLQRPAFALLERRQGVQPELANLSAMFANWLRSSGDVEADEDAKAFRLPLSSPSADAPSTAGNLFHPEALARAAASALEGLLPAAVIFDSARWWRHPHLGGLFVDSLWYLRQGNEDFFSSSLEGTPFALGESTEGDPDFFQSQELNFRVAPTGDLECWMYTLLVSESHGLRIFPDTLTLEETYGPEGVMLRGLGQCSFITPVGAPDASPECTYIFRRQEQVAHVRLSIRHDGDPEVLEYNLTLAA